jgi:sensor histidine kinase YesM
MADNAYPVPDAYTFLFVMLTTLIIGLSINLAWLAAKERSLSAFLKRLRISFALLLCVVLILLAIETLLMVFFQCSYLDVIAYIVADVIEWRPSLVYGWMIVHRLLLILFLSLLIYPLLNKRNYYSWGDSHLKKIKTCITGDLLKSKLKNSAGIKVIATCGLIWGMYCLAMFSIALILGLKPFDYEFLVFATGFGASEFHMLLGSLFSLILGLLLVVTSARLLYLKTDAWWITLAVLALCELSSIRAMIYFLTHNTLGGIINLAFAFVLCVIFGIFIYLVFRNVSAYRVSAQSTEQLL